MPTPLISGASPRLPSPTRGFSTFTTSAPSCSRIWLASGPDMCVEKSTTLSFSTAMVSAKTTSSVRRRQPSARLIHWVSEGLVQTDHAVHVDRGADALGHFGSQLDLGCCAVLLDVPDAARTGDCKHKRRPREKPRKRQLTRRAPHIRCNGLQPLQMFQVAAEILTLEARHRAPKVFRSKVGLRPQRAGEKAAAERRVGNHRDAKIFKRRKHVAFNPSHP